MAFFSYRNRSVYYEQLGTGSPVLLLHGNTASGRMFEEVKKIFLNDFEVIIPDYPGHGRSERLDRFETDFWYQQALMCKELLDFLHIDKAIVAGASGGALVGINLALEYPEKVRFLLADSFKGEHISVVEAKSLANDREDQKKRTEAVAFWEKQHGSHWERVIDADTEMLVRFSKLEKSFFNKSLAQMAVRTWLSASKEDFLCPQMEALFHDLKPRNQHFRLHLFEKGNHPAMLSNKNDLYRLVVQELTQLKDN